MDYLNYVFVKIWPQRGVILGKRVVVVITWDPEAGKLRQAYCSATGGCPGWGCLITKLPWEMGESGVSLLPGILEGPYHWAKLGTVDSCIVYNFKAIMSRKIAVLISSNLNKRIHLIHQTVRDFLGIHQARA